MTKRKKEKDQIQLDVSDCGIKGAATLRISHGKYNKKQGNLFTEHLCNSDGEAVMNEERRFNADVCAAFRPLLEDPAAVMDAMRPMRGVGSDVGDSMVALTTLIHRGPGNADRSSSGDSGARKENSRGKRGKLAKRTARRVLFFDVKPQFRNPTTGRLEGGDIGDYEPEYQVHAAYLLSRARASSYMPKDRDQRRVRDAYKELGYDLSQFEPPPLAAATRGGSQ